VRDSAGERNNRLGGGKAGGVRRQGSEGERARYAKERERMVRVTE
jgi:hypothetical protein